MRSLPHKSAACDSCTQGGRKKRLEEQGRAAEAARQGLIRQRSRMERVLAGADAPQGNGDAPPQGEELSESAAGSDPEPARCSPWLLQQHWAHETGSRPTVLLGRSSSLGTFCSACSAEQMSVAGGMPRARKSAL